MREQKDFLANALKWIDEQTMCRDFDKKVLPYAFAFARERARESTRLMNQMVKNGDTVTNARLARFMAHDWIKESGNMRKRSSEQIVLEELATVKQWI